VSAPVKALDQTKENRPNQSKTEIERIDVLGVVPSAMSDESRTIRVVLWLNRLAPYRRSELAATADGLPRRVFVDLEEVKLGKQVNPALPVGAGGVIRIRSFVLDGNSRDETTLRVSFDVGRRTEYHIFSLTHPYRIVMDFRDPRPRAKPRGENESYTIVLDPGHGGADTGARGADGSKESALSFDVAVRVEEVLRAFLSRPRVILTRGERTGVSLEERAAIANGYNADVFVSIHFDASSSRRESGGVSTHVIDTSDSGQARRLAAAENGTTAGQVTELQTIFASLEREKQLARSLILARSVQRQTVAEGRKLVPDLVDLGTSHALFYVLIGTRMPSVLIEASFIAGGLESVFVGQPQYRQALATGIARGIVGYLQTLSAQKKDPGHLNHETPKPKS
jgi:N-acetylmuramoyl-L-alanine amidase